MDYDLIVIGAGSAGYNGASLAHRLGIRVALIDGAQELGGLCILRGCMPSKALLAGANRFEQARHSEEFGISSEKIEIDLPTLLARKDHHINEFASHRQSQINSGKFPFIHGHAQFADANTIELTSGSEAGRRISARYFLIATGSELTPPKLPGLAETGFEYSDTILSNPRLPKSVIILGAGAIALEFAQYYNALGTHVTILQRSARILKGSDLQAAEALQIALEKRGMRILTGVTLESARRSENGKTVAFQHEGREREFEAEEIFYALGRRPKTEGLFCEESGIAIRPLRPTMQCNSDHVFLAGDIAGPYEIVHIAIQQAELAVRNIHRLLKNDPSLEEMDYRCKLFVLFTKPELAQVGLTEQEAHHEGRDILTASYPFDDHGKSLVMGETDGFVKLVAERSSGEIIGASVLGPEASSLIHEVAAVMHFRGTASELARMPHYHPTLSEIWTYPAEEIADQVG